jgi:hypothetical protein
MATYDPVVTCTAFLGGPIRPVYEARIGRQ